MYIAALCAGVCAQVRPLCLSHLELGRSFVFGFLLALEAIGGLMLSHEARITEQCRVHWSACRMPIQCVYTALLTPLYLRMPHTLACPSVQP